VSAILAIIAVLSRCQVSVRPVKGCGICLSTSATRSRPAFATAALLGLMVPGTGCSVNSGDGSDGSAGET
jgi:hypothetical protein